MKVGFIGLGTMGASMASNLQAGGHELQVNDVREGRGRAASEGGRDLEGHPAPGRGGRGGGVHLAARAARRWSRSRSVRTGSSTA